MASSSALLIPFVQFEFAGRLGLNQGRFAVRDEAGPDAPARERVLIVQTFDVSHPGSGRTPRRRRKSKPVDPPAEPKTVPLARFTIAGSTRFATEEDAKKWLEEIADDIQARKAEVDDALEVVNRALEHLQEITEDPAISPLDIGSSLEVRLGYGNGDQIADGHWTAARNLPSFQRHHDLDRQRQVAIKLSGREEDEDPPS